MRFLRYAKVGRPGIRSLCISEFVVHYESGISLQKVVFLCPQKLHSMHKRWLATLPTAFSQTSKCKQHFTYPCVPSLHFLAPAPGPALAHALAMLLLCPWPHTYPYPSPYPSPYPCLCPLLVPSFLTPGSLTRPLWMTLLVCSAVQVHSPVCLR